ncbi:uncharacterized protein LOC124909818 [Impatiens glandulifera]|uniref:uncharacterized protein LOC124909818 n=1 Tax=Impatiens glandulifera TaxID=253017 RepID=UPI001FB16E0D|nr:uncharacterized protein LOC124909818 [Impatiens glandulifera]
MALTSSFLPSRPLHLHRKTVIQSKKRLIPARKITLMRRESHNHNDGQNMVDEGMLILRMRIHEMKLADKNYESPPEEWMWWEKQVYGDYDAFICDVMGMLQSWLLETRPATAVGFLVILALSLPISAATVMFHVARILIAGHIP